MDFKALLDSDGRLRRKDYVVLVIPIAFIIGIIIHFFGGVVGNTISLMFGAVCLVAGVKRLHDVNLVGWFILLGLIPFVNIVLGLYLLFKDGTVGPNTYGPDPKGRMPAENPVPTPPQVPPTAA